MTIGAFEILLVIFLILLIIGPRRIADLGKALGRGVRDFRLEFDRDRRGGELSDSNREEESEKKR